MLSWRCYTSVVCNFNNNKGGKLPEVLTPLSLLSKNNLTSPLKPQLFMNKD